MTEDVAALKEEIRKLKKINASLMARVERSTDISGSAFALFQTAIALEEEVNARTRDLQQTLETLSETNARLEMTRREAESARQNLADALEAVQEAFVLFGPDDTLVMCNSRFRALLPDISTGLVEGLPFADYAAMIAKSRHLVLMDDQTNDDWVNFRMQMHGKPHATFICELSGDHWVQVSERRTANGAAAILQTDITDMVRQQRIERDKMLDQHAILARATLDHLSQGVVTFDERNRLAAANTRFRELLNLPYGLIEPGTSLSRIFDFAEKNGDFHPEDRVPQLQDWLERPAFRSPISIEYRRSDDAMIAVSLRSMPHGGFVASFTDVTAERAAVAALERGNETLEQRVAERTAALTRANAALTHENAERERIHEALHEAKEAAEAADLSKTRFLAAASHDLLQPMNAAKLFISTLAETELEGAQQEVVTRLSGAFASVETLLHTLLEISRLDSGAAEATVEDVQVQSVLDFLDQSFRPLAEAKGLTFHIKPCPIVVQSDSRYLRRIAQNLVANAVKYTEKGAVLVACRRAGDMARFEVRDSGPGIGVEDHERIFEEFQRLDQDYENRGMGLGLSIVERACRLLGHKLSLRSSPGKGSVFAFETPISTLKSEVMAKIEAEDEAGVEAARLNLIAAVIENEPDVLFAMTRTLEGWGASVAPASSTEEAMAAIRDLGLPPDIIIADYHLDGGDTGFASIQALRAEWGSDLPAMLVTADRTKELARRARAEGIDVLSKPVEPRKLRSLITWRGVAAT